MTPQPHDTQWPILQHSVPQSMPLRRRVFGALAAGAAAIGVSLAFHRAAHAHGPDHRGRFMRGSMGPLGPMDPETMGRRIDAMVAYALADVDATVEQRSRIGAIVKAAANDLMPLRQQHRDARKQMADLFVAPTPDRGRFEALRVSQMQLGDTFTRRASQALMDVAEVLTAQQRATLAQKWQRRHSRG